MKTTLQIGETLVTFRPLTIKEVYNADLMPPEDPDMWPLYLAFESEFPLVLLSADCAPELLLDGVESEVLEAFRKANPFLLKPLQMATRDQRNKALASLFSGQSANLFNVATQERGTTP